MIKLFLCERFFSLDLSFEGVVKDDCCDVSCDNNSKDEKELNKSNEVSNNESEKLGSPQSTHIHVQDELARIRYISSPNGAALRVIPQITMITLYPFLIFLNCLISYPTGISPIWPRIKLDIAAQR